MLDMLTLNQKKWLVDNRYVLSNQATSLVIGIASAMVGTLCTVAFNQHDYEMKRVVRNERDEDFVVFEDVSFANELRDSLRPNFREEEKKELDATFGKGSSSEDKDKKKDKKKKKNKKKGGLFS